MKGMTNAKNSGGPSAYIKSASVSGNTLTLTKQDNTTITFTPAEIRTNLLSGAVTLDKNASSNYVDITISDALNVGDVLEFHIDNQIKKIKLTSVDTELHFGFSYPALHYGIVCIDVAIEYRKTVIGATTLRMYKKIFYAAEAQGTSTPTTSTPICYSSQTKQTVTLYAVYKLN